jgi:radical SAM superfamily enzyme YgiQ (UPF0313 family)
MMAKSALPAAGAGGKKPLKVLLCNATGGNVSDYGALAKAAPKFPPLGLACIAATAKERGHRVDILDAAAEPFTLEGLAARIKAGDYDVVGFSAYITTKDNVLYFTEGIKNACPEITVCVGGPQATLAPDMFRTRFIDYIFVGESDESFPGLCDFLAGGRAQVGPTIAGLIDNHDSSPASRMRPAGFPLVFDLDSLPLLRLDEYYDLDKYYPPVDTWGGGGGGSTPPVGGPGGFP